MTSIFKIADGVPCRACGAVLARASANRFGICDSCWTQVLLHSGATYDMRKTGPAKSGVTEEAVTQWLASKLIKDVKRLKRTQLIGRCEAISGWAYGHPGTQCAHVAVKVRDGHVVCGLHAKATAPVYVSERRADPYEMMRDILTDLVNVDDRFAQVLTEVAMSIDDN